jgi:DNA-binding SARP family transcriptional activator
LRKPVQEEETASITVRLLGSFTVLYGDVPVQRFRAGKSRALLQYLLVYQGQPVSRTALMDALWPTGNAPETSLKVAAHALRSVLRSSGQHVGQDAALELVSYEHGYLLRATNACIDLDRFESTMRSAVELDARGRAAEALPLYDEAVRLHRGEFLTGESEDWIMLRRERIKDLLLQGLSRLMEVKIARRDYSAGLMLGQRMLDVDTCHEHTYRMMMLCHGQLGQPGRVVRWYQLCERTLRTELGVEPQDATRRVMTSALREGPADGRLIAS